MPAPIYIYINHFFLSYPRAFNRETHVPYINDFVGTVGLYKLPSKK